MTELFVPYEEAKALRDLGFNEECLTTYLNGELETKEMFFFTHTFRSHKTQEFISAPLYSQAFKWFREKHNAHYAISRYPQGAIEASNKNGGNLKKYGWYICKDELNPSIPKDGSGQCDTYEEAELTCLRKLIEITKKK